MNIEYFKQRLMAERREVEERFEQSGKYGLDDSMSDELSELSLYDNHPADVASELYERGKDLGLKVTDKARLADIDRALSAIEQGTYGRCEHCGGSIDEERLEANPTSLLCLDCKKAEESTHPRRQRPIEEYVLYPGYGRSNFDDTTVVEFDGEDSWQAVDRFNERPAGKMVYDEIYMDDNEGIVDPIDVISDEQYRNQLP